MILTNVDGLLDGAGAVVPVVKNIDQVAGLVRVDIGRVSKGGMFSKLQAARRAVEAGVPVYIASG